MSHIDPGIEGTVKEAAEDAEKQPDARKQQREDEDLTSPSTWWFASTACPLLAATFGPIANGFSICALVYSWRAYIPPNGTQADGIKMTDPKWLLAVNAVSLVSALVGNAALLLNMAKRIKFSIAQPITITGFLLAGVLLIADMAAITSDPNYFITELRALEPGRHALTSAYYYAIWAAGIYMIIGLLMCLTVYGANKRYYAKDFNLTSAQRTLMLQTMSFIGYLLLGALVFSTIEDWKYLDALYWADVTLLTVGLGDYSPQTHVGRGLLFPFAIGGILMVGLVVGSIRTLVLERGKEKMAARITEKRRESAVHNVDERKQTIKVSWFAQADFSTDPSLSPAQRREEEFNVMRKVQVAAEKERRYFSLATSLFFALCLWFVGAAVFMVCERHEQGWTYFQSVYFTFVVLMTIGYGDITPTSNAGKAVFVIWSLLAVPSLTILISNLGDTFVKWFTDLTNYIASVTILPERKGIRGAAKDLMDTFTDGGNDEKPTSSDAFSPPGLLGMMCFGSRGHQHEKRMHRRDHHTLIMDQLAARLAKHVAEDELDAAIKEGGAGHLLDRDIHFYHYVLARELRRVQGDLSASPPKQYSWHDWEYFLMLMGNEDDVPEFSGQQHPDVVVPDAMRQPDAPFSPGAFEKRDFSVGASDAGHHHGEPISPLSSTSSDVPADKDGVTDRETKRQLAPQQSTNARKTHGLRRRPTHDDDPLSDWSWLSDSSPLMSKTSEAEWISERLSTALERELNRQRKGQNRKPPIGMGHVVRAKRVSDRGE